MAGDCRVLISVCRRIPVLRGGVPLLPDQLAEELGPLCPAAVSPRVLLCGQALRAARSRAEAGIGVQCVTSVQREPNAAHSWMENSRDLSSLLGAVQRLR